MRCSEMEVEVGLLTKGVVITKLPESRTRTEVKFEAEAELLLSTRPSIHRSRSAALEAPKMYEVHVVDQVGPAVVQY